MTLQLLLDLLDRWLAPTGLLGTVVFYLFRTRGISGSEAPPEAKREARRVLRITSGVLIFTFITGWFGLAAIGIVAILAAKQTSRVSGHLFGGPLAAGAAALRDLYLRRIDTVRLASEGQGFRRWFPSDPRVKELHKEAL